MDRGRFDVVYLIHFDRPLCHAQHYLGWTNDLGQRLADHEAGRGARLMAVIAEVGITWCVARLWMGTRTLEKRLKTRHGPYRLCPICASARTTRERGSAHESALLRSTDDRDSAAAEV